MMKIYTLNNIILGMVQIFGVLTLLLLLGSCGKDNTDDTVAPDASGTFLSFSVDGVTEPTIKELRSKVSARSYQNSPLRSDERMVSVGDFDALVSFQSGSTKGDNGLYSLRASQQSRSSMPSTVKYRILVYKGSTLVANREAVSGTDPLIYVDPATSYSWYAFSINEGTVPDIDNNGRVSGGALANRDFVYAKGTISTIEGKNHLNIVFAREMVRFDVEINVRGMFGLIHDDTKVLLGHRTGDLPGGDFVNLIKTADFDVLGGGFVSSTIADPSSSDIAVSGVDMVAIGPGGIPASVKIATFFSIPNVTTLASNTLRVELNPLVLRMDDNSLRTFPSSIAPVSHPSFNFSKGYLYQPGLRLIESAVVHTGLTHTGSSQTVHWARTNLTYAPSHHDKWRFRVDNNLTPDLNNDFWNFVPVGGAPTGSPHVPGLVPANVHPCRRIYPENTWGSTHLESAYWTLGLPDATITENGIAIAVWDVDAGSPNSSAYGNNNKLRIPALGYRSVGGTRQSMTELQYWASGFNPIDNQTTEEASYYRMTNSGGHNWTRYAYGKDWGPDGTSFNSNNGAGGIDLWGNAAEGRSIRCVRITGQLFPEYP